MKNILIAAAITLFAAVANAGDINLNSTGFGDLSLNRLKTGGLELPAPFPGRTKRAAEGPGYVTGEITELHLLPQAGRNVLATYADTELLFREFVDMWTPILKKFSLEPAGTEYKDTFGTLAYAPAGGLVVRDFIGEQLQYDALDPAAINKLQRELLEPLEKEGLTPIASFTVRNEALRPTFKLYYLTQPRENPSHETRLRQLKNGEDIDFDIIENSVRFVKKDTPFSLVYIGKELGFKTKAAATEESARLQLEEYRKFLDENNKEFIGSRIIKLETPYYVSDSLVINYIVNIYFFQ